MFRKYIPKILWDYDTTYIYALKIISIKAYSARKLQEKLSIKTTKEISMQVIQDLQDNNFLHDTQVCLDTAIFWTEKKPISKIQLMKKLSSYGFDASDIQNAIMIIEKKYTNGELSSIGGLSVEYFAEYLESIKNNIVSSYGVSFWETMMFCSCIQMIRTSADDITNDRLKSRLKLKGYGISIHIDIMINAIKQIEKKL